MLVFVSPPATWWLPSGYRARDGESSGAFLIYSPMCSMCFARRMPRTFGSREGDPMNLRKTVAADFVVAFAALVGLVVAVAVSLAPASAFAAEPPLEAGFYSAQVETSSDAEALTSVVDSPCLLEVPSTGQTVARIAWSKNDVVRMIVNDVEYLPSSSDVSEFVIPVLALDEPLSVQVEVASQPNELLTAQLTFFAASVDNSDEALDALAADTEYEAVPLSLEGEGQESSSMEAAANSQQATPSVEWVTFAGWAVIAVVVIGIGASIFIRVRKGK